MFAMLTSSCGANPQRPRVLRAALLAAVLCSLPDSVAAQSEAVEYYATDAIGSVRVVFDSSGNVTGRMDYAPFGEELYTGLFLPSERFADLTRDSEAGQDYAQARMYQVRTGRFSVPDPIFAGAFNPQLWNRYTYGVNNPIRFTDPAGLCPEEPCLHMPWHEVVNGRYDLAGGAAGGTGRGSSEDELVGSFDEEVGGLSYQQEGQNGSTVDETDPDTTEPCGPGNPSADITEFIPVYGPARSAIRNFEAGSPGWGVFDTVMAITDLGLIKGAVSGIARGFIKPGSQSWPAVRKWYGKTRNLEPDTPVHHFLIPQKSKVPDRIKNNPLNLTPMGVGRAGRELHQSVHGKAPGHFGPLGKFVYGTPLWFKGATASTVGKTISVTVPCQ